MNSYHSTKKMRYLNKLVLINSAHVRYAEVAMAGNIHFTGTQGVGKTTLLRALLFFYNCRKDRLGIRTQGQQTFDGFYIPTSSSYIIYEVSRGTDEPAFSIILFRHNNRAAFRFVDSPYSRDWFVDEYGVVASDHLTVRQRIQAQGIDVSGIIERYGQYLDILYGNGNAHLSKDLSKYYLLRSRQYHNIPRIIQNVFLNERVDADFIKNTIINSICDEEEQIAVDLDLIRSRLVHFNDELRDITLWTQTNRQGIVETKADAERIISLSHGIKAARSAVREKCGMLRYAMDKAARDIPLLRNKIDRKQQSVSEIESRLKELDSRFEKEKEKITGRLAVLKNELRRASDLKKEYQRLGIEDMIARAARRDSLALGLEQKERFLAKLSDSHRLIAEKYETLRDRIQLDKEQYSQTVRERKNNAVSEFNDREKDRLRRTSELESEIRGRAESLVAEVDERLDSSRELLNEQKVQRVRVSASSPMKEEIAACERDIAETERKISRLSEERLQKGNRLDAVRNKLELDCRQVESETELQIKEIEGEIGRLEAKRQQELELLARSEGSLCEWLDGNVEGWERNIGKIADEKSVLYSTGLCPRKSDGPGDSFFGISLDLDSIDREVRTPSMIRESVGSLEKEAARHSASIIELRNGKDSRIAGIQKEVKGEINSLRNAIEEIARNVTVGRKQEREYGLRLEELKEQEKSRIESVVAEFDDKIQDLQLKIEELLKERSVISDRCKAERSKAIKAVKDEAKADKTRLDELLKAIDDDLRENVGKYAAQMQRLGEDENAELTASGADMALIDSTRKDIAEIKDSLARIDSERDKISDYRKDCRDLLDHVGKKQLEKKKLEDEAEALRRKFDERRRRHEAKRDEERQALDKLRGSLDRTQESKRQAEEFVVSRHCPAEMNEEVSRPTSLDCKEIISAIKDLTAEIYRDSDSLKEKTNEFRRRFSANNTFHFPTVFDTIDDYHRYAESLDDFVSNDKIKEYQHVTSAIYRDVLSRTASDFNILLSRETEIDRIVREINYDFAKKTFAGVIRKIELRLARSRAPIVTQMQNITDFWLSHQYELGEVNLFSTDSHADVNREAIKYLESLLKVLNETPEMRKLPLEQSFALEFQIQENDNVIPWTNNVRAVGSEGTDILVKAIVNILLISVFKKRAGKGADFRLHCMMDEIGRLADENIQGILEFANERGIFVVNSSPKAHRPLSYRHLYMLSKDAAANTVVQPILSTREAELK